jgi:peptidoglycan/xylan/chitin deacetylase (PgdA/CDA1 family)
VVNLTFDDGDADQMAAARVLRAHGMRGTFYIVTGAIGTNAYTTRGDLRELAAYGDEIAAHTVSHLRLPQISPAEARRQVCDSRDILAGWGYHMTSFAYPGAAYDGPVEAIVRDCGLDSARIGNGIRSGICPGCAVAETIPPRNPTRYALPGRSTPHGR